MCGIIAYSGHRPAQDVLIHGLKGLEYRGYDSAGICLQQDNQLQTIRAKGKVTELQKKVRDTFFCSTTGIAHTRWATHGAPSEHNAHPHISNDSRFAVVHNGIIENYAILRKKLLDEGYVFNSETDTEVIVHLIAKHYTGNLKNAVLKTIPLLEGSYGIAAISADEPGTIIGVRKSSPLILGIGKDELFLASDASPLVEYTKQVIYLDDNDIVEIKGKEYNILCHQNVQVNREIKQLEYDATSISKEGFDHFMLKEIFEQPQSITNAMRGRIVTDQGTVRLDGLNLIHQELRGIKKIIIVGCGTSFYASIVGEYLIEELAGISVEVEYASEFRYRNPIVEQDTLVFCVSQSGETADTLAALREAKQKGATVLGICNVVGSSIARETDGGIYLHAGPEIGVASTKAFTSQITTLIMLALLLGRMRRLSSDTGMSICRELEAIPNHVKQILTLNDSIRTIAMQYAHATNFLYLGRGYNYPVALEGALKLKETAYIHAEGYPAAEMKHGPIALIDKNMPTVIIAPTDPLFEKILSNMQEIKARAGRVIVITDANPNMLNGMADHVIQIPKTIPILTPLLTVIPLQLLAYHMAVIRGCNVDQPRNLAKSVTVE
jgi:glucosamine--fructose-6-phosphate aminotransferase (isomerizing)